MTDIEMQIEQIESARLELKKHFGEHYELSALTHTIPLLEELKIYRELGTVKELTNIRSEVVRKTIDEHNCKECTHYYKAFDAPQGTEDCHWEPSGDEKERPCEKAGGNEC